MGKVVLVTGVSRDLGRRFARRLAAEPGVDRVIGVDAVPPRDDLGDVSFVRADIRNPVIAKVIAKEDVDTVVHMSVIATPGSAGGRGVDEGAQRHRHHAAARRLPEGPRPAAPGREVDLDRLRRHQPRPGDVHRGHGAAAGSRAPATPRTSPRSRATSAASPAAAPTSGSRRCGWPTSLGPHVTSPMTSLLPAAGDPDRARLRPPAAVPARERPAARARPRASTPRCPARSTSPVTA